MNFSHQITQIRRGSENNIEVKTNTSQKSQILLQNSCLSQQGRSRGKPKSYSNKYQYNWNKIQQRKYINFLIKRRDLFDLTNEERKCQKINLVMSEAIKTRTAAQCHSHHQKMMIKFGGIDDIIQVHLHLITKKLVPKNFIGLIRDLQQYKRSEDRETKDAEQISEVIKENSHPYWMDFVDYDHFFSYQSFPEDASSLL